MTMPVAAPARLRPGRRWLTLRALVLAMAALLAVAGASSGGLSWWVFRTTGAAFARARHDAARVVAAQTMATAAEGIDAGLTELLLTNSADATAVRAGLQAFDAALLEAGRNSVPAAESLPAATGSAGQPDADAVAAVSAAWGDYRFTVAAALQSLRLGQNAEAAALSQQAGAQLSDRLRPAVLRLDRLDRQDIDRSTATARAALQQGSGWILGLGWGLGAALLVAALVMALLTHRRLNAGLLVGLFVTLLVWAVAASQVGAARGDVQQALAGHFERLHEAVQMEQALSATHSAGNRWLIDRAGAVSHDLAYGHNDRLVRQYLDRLAGDKQLTGWPPAAFRQDYDRFFSQDRRMREAYLAGDASGALRLSREAVLPVYGKLMESVAGLRRQEQQQFATEVDAAVGRLARDELVLWPLLAVAALVAFGVAGRLRDF